MTIAWTLHTGFGAWNPMVWLVAVLFALFVGWLIRSLGRNDCKKNTEQTKPFISGNAEPAKEDVHIRAGNLYWGFLEALKDYYARLVPLHSGVVTDYLLWFFGVVSILLIIGLVV